MAIDSPASNGMKYLESGRFDRMMPVAALLQTLALVGIITVCLFGITIVTRLSHVSIAYLVAVLIAAIRWGALPAVVAAVGGIVASAFFFYPPLYDLRVSDPQHVMDLALFVAVAIVTGHLADSTRAHMRAAQKREDELRSLYTFSKRLAVSSTGQEILASVRNHLSAVVGHRVLLFHAHWAGDAGPSGDCADSLPEAVRDKFSQTNRGIEQRPLCVDDATGSVWLVGPVSQSNAGLGTIAVNLGRRPPDDLERLRQSLQAALVDASATLERLDVANALGEAQARSSRETFREALIGSVSHELRTPLAAILGAASVLSRAEIVLGDDRLAQLAEIVRSEAERLDNDIQKLLDASRISGDCLHPQPTWTDPADLVNAAVESCGRRAEGQKIEVHLSKELPLAYVDPALIEQALRQIVDNATKYSPSDSTITITVRGMDDRIVISVRDAGMGITADEQKKLYERFYRGSRHKAAQPGSGLGLWIARAFITASGGRLGIESGGCNQGTIVTISLPAPEPTEHIALDDGDE